MKSLILILGSALSLVLLCLYFFQRKLIYYPSRSKPRLEGFLSKYYKEVQIQTKDGLNLTHWITQTNTSPWIVIFHGNAGNIEGRGYKFQFLAEHNHSVLIASYRGYGDNPGKPTEEHLIQDSELILQWLIKTHNPSEIILYGESLGSGVAIALAAKYPVHKLILEGAPSSILDVGQKHVFPLLPVRWILKDTWLSRERIKHIQIPSLFIHGRKDRTVPFPLGMDLYEKAPNPKTHLWLDERGHNDLLDDPRSVSAILEFIHSK